MDTMDVHHQQAPQQLMRNGCADGAIRIILVALGAAALYFFL